MPLYAYMCSSVHGDDMRHNTGSHCQWWQQHQGKQKCHISLAKLHSASKPCSVCKASPSGNYICAKNKLKNVYGLRSKPLFKCNRHTLSRHLGWMKGGTHFCIDSLGVHSLGFDWLLNVFHCFHRTSAAFSHLGSMKGGTHLCWTEMCYKLLTHSTIVQCEHQTCKC